MPEAERALQADLVVCPAAAHIVVVDRSHLVLDHLVEDRLVDLLGERSRLGLVVDPMVRQVLATDSDLLDCTKVKDEHIHPHKPVGFDTTVVHIVVVDPALGIARHRILAEAVEVLLHTCSVIADCMGFVVAGCTSSVVADRTSSVEDTAGAVGSSAVVGRVVWTEVVAKVQGGKATRRHTERMEERCTCRK